MVIERITEQHKNYVMDRMMIRWDVSREYAEAEVQRWIDGEAGSTCFVGIVDGLLVATGAIDGDYELDFYDCDKYEGDKKPFWNTLLWVEPEFRGNGYGLMLTQARFDHALALGAREVYLDTFNAKEYHLKNGWQVVEEGAHEGEQYAIMKYDLARPTEAQVYCWWTHFQWGLGAPDQYFAGLEDGFRLGIKYLMDNGYVQLTEKGRNYVPHYRDEK